MANHRYTSLSELLDASQRRTPFVSRGSDDNSFPTEMFGELCFRERSSPRSSRSSIWDLFTPPLPPPRALPNAPPLHDHAEVEGLNENHIPDPNQVPDLNEEGADPDQVPDLNENEDVCLNENESSQNQVQGLNESSTNPDLENENKTDEGKENLAKNNCCKYDNSGKLFPPPLSTMKMNRAGKPLVYHEFDAEKNGFVKKMIFLPHEIMAASRACGRLRMRFAHDFAAAEEEKEKSSDKAEEKVAANGVKHKPQA